MIKALKNTILVTDFKFGERTVNGIILRDDNGTTRGIRPRWGKVFSIGDNVNDVLIGQWVMIEHGRWSHGVSIDVNDEKLTVYKIDPSAIMLISDNEPTDEYVNRE